jgi:hypothetical protein
LLTSDQLQLHRVKRMRTCIDLTDTPSTISAQPLTGDGLSTTLSGHLAAFSRLLQEEADTKTTLEHKCETLQATITSLQATITSLQVQLTEATHETTELRSTVAGWTLDMTLKLCNTCGNKLNTDDEGTEAWVSQSCGAVSELIARSQTVYNADLCYSQSVAAASKRRMACVHITIGLGSSHVTECSVLCACPVMRRLRAK